MVNGVSPCRAVAAIASSFARAVVCAAVLLCVAFSLVGLAARSAQADAAGGYFTLAGVVGVDEAAAFYSFADAVAAVASCDPSAQLQDPSSAIVVVHGTVYLDAFQLGGVLDLFYPVDGATYAVVGADGAACIVVSGGALGLSNAGGSLVLHGLTVSGDLSLSCRDDLVVDACAVNGGLVCQAGGDVGVAGNVFEAPVQGTGCALSAVLSGCEGTLSFVGNSVSGYACAIEASCSHPQNAAMLSVTANRFDLMVSDAAADGLDTVLRLGGGPWNPASLVRDGNTVDAARVLLTLDGSFALWAGETVQSVADGTLTAEAVAALFQMTGSGTSTLPEDMRGVLVAPEYADTYVAEQVGLASEWVLPSPSGVAALPVYTVSYNANGATGAACEPVRVEAGATVSAANMGSLILPNYTFQGWNTAPDGSGAFYAVGQVFSPQGDMVLYAQWAPSGTVATMDVSAGAGV